MPRTSVIVRTTIQSAALKAAANLTTQLAAQYRVDSPQPLNWQRVLEFCIFGVLQAPVGCYWQEFLEETFPTRGTIRVAAAPAWKDYEHRGHQESKDTVATASEDTTNWWNVLWKLLIDQTIGLFIMNTLFLTVMNTAQVQSSAELLAVVRARVFRIIRAAWNLWPAVAIINFLWVPVEKRVLVGACVGFGWNIFLSIITAVK
ncbi:hypothetical protein NKR23_g411 [Pleurostoma richardsiae]|uniref:Uncharacterized protein n=1 Tax=Pleurostoma richardsiae TaxID=41990 RepID=A0AA38VXY9_9PEZI|nr:hypothetical protein NKR23_g411 [Pleurostoma richardsiae]